MKKINFENCENNAVINAANNKVSAVFVQELQEAFSMFPDKTNLRFKQSPQGQLIILVTVVYATGIVQHFEGAGDTDLISAIQFGMAKITKLLDGYKSEEHEIDIAKEGGNLVVELFKQYISSPMRGHIEADWYNSNGERYRCVRFSPTFNKNIKFCLKATDEVNNLIREACKPNRMKRTEAQAKIEISEQQKGEVA